MLIHQQNTTARKLNLKLCFKGMELACGGFVTTRLPCIVLRFMQKHRKSIMAGRECGAIRK